ncbi:MAG: DUF3325 domain-containing protein [Rhodospirillales bacterium]|nr:DUF3325 domain-containing protein [Rhodospirillales bacterium]MBN8926799.1 DUF3325 domain-containing protein [Rhodospirillales bacterium]
MTLLAFGLAEAGFVVLALAMDRHARQLAVRRPPTWARAKLRAAGLLLLLLALRTCMSGWGGAEGVVAWCGVLTLAALLLALALALPRRVRTATALLVLLPLLGALLHPG